MNKSLLFGLFSVCVGSMFALSMDAQTHEHRTEFTSQSAVRPSMEVKLKEKYAKATVVSSKELGRGMKMQVCEDANGRLFKRMAGVVPMNSKVNAMRKTASNEVGGAFVESFEGYDGSESWLPEGWTRKSTEGLEYYQSWFVSAPGVYTPAAADGNYFAEIVYAETEQDEWLMTPEITVPENGILSFYSFLQPAFLFDMSDECVDWDNMTFIEKRRAATLQVMISVDNGDWTLLKDMADDYEDMSLMDLLNATPSELTKTTINLSDYFGKTVKIAFRYVGKNGDSMFIDNVKVGLPELAASYTNPAGTLFYGLDKNFNAMQLSIMMEPVYTPLTWTNTTYNDAANYSWLYHDPVTNDMATVESTDLCVTYKPDYTNEFTTRNNLYYLPTLTASAPGAGDGSYKASYDYLQAGGRADWKFDGNEDLSTFGLMTCDILTEGMTIMTVATDDPMETSVPIFGHNEKTTEWWTNHYFQGDQTEEDKAEVNGIINFFQAPASPMVINGLWLSARGQVGDNAEFTAAIYPLSDEFVPAEEPIAMATCKGSDLVVIEGGIQNYLTLPFSFASPVVVSDKDFAYYIVEISGFNSDEVTYFAPLQSAMPNPDGMCYGWLDVNITNSGVERNTLVPIANFESEMGECYNSFFINLDGTYPWLQGDDDEFEAKAEGGSKEFTVDSYYDASELKFSANTTDGTLPSWMNASCEGRYGDTKLTFTVASGTETSSCDVTVYAPGVSKTYRISRDAATGIEMLETTPEADKVVGIYNVSGQRVDNAGNAGRVRIVKYADGTVRKIAK